VWFDGYVPSTGDPLPFCWEVITDEDKDAEEENGEYEKVTPVNEEDVGISWYSRNPFTLCTGTGGTYICRPPF
jgi:hypothetical protein